MQYVQRQINDENRPRRDGCTFSAPIQIGKRRSHVGFFYFTLFAIIFTSTLLFTSPYSLYILCTANDRGFNSERNAIHPFTFGFLV